MELERAANGGRASLFRMSGGVVGMDGRPVPSGGWTYVFYRGEPPLRRTFTWNISTAGEIRPPHPEGREPLHLDVMRELVPPMLEIDSDRAVQLALGYGGQPYVDRYGERVQITAFVHYVITEPIWQVKFADGPPLGQECDLEILLHARTGVLMATSGRSCATR